MYHYHIKLTAELGREPGAGAGAGAAAAAAGLAPCSVSADTHHTDSQPQISTHRTPQQNSSRTRQNVGIPLTKSLPSLYARMHTYAHRTTHGRKIKPVVSLVCASWAACPLSPVLVYISKYPNTHVRICIRRMGAR